MGRPHDKKTQKFASTPKKPTVTYAGFWSRFLAFITDLFMIGMPITLLIMVLFGYETMQSQPGFVEGLEGKQSANPYIPLVTLFLWMGTLLIFWVRTAQTPGMKMAHIRIVDSHSLDKAGSLQLFVRLLIYSMPIFALFSIPIMLFHPQKRTLHDIFSKTSVIYT